VPEGEYIGVLLGVLAIVIVIRTLVGAVILRAAVAIFNKLAAGASSPSSVPEPAYGKAMWIIFAASLAQMVVGALISLRGAGEAAGARGQDVDSVPLLIAIPVNLLIMAGVLSGKLPTTFGRSFLVTLCYTLVETLVVGIIVALAILVFGVTLR
jgi:hypothetical protein